jgi:hypothetical protein
MKKPKAVKEPIQVYMEHGERRLLDRMAAEMGLSRAEVLRQGLRRFASETAGADGPMQKFMDVMRKKPLPADIALEHDEHLAAAYTDMHRQ